MTKGTELTCPSELTDSIALGWELGLDIFKGTTFQVIVLCRWG